MVRECRPRERELSSLKLARRSTMTTSVPANVSSAASIIPVGPPPAITTACSAIHHSSFPNACQETLRHTPGLAASPGLLVASTRDWLASPYGRRPDGGWHALAGHSPRKAFESPFGTLAGY